MLEKGPLFEGYLQCLESNGNHKDWGWKVSKEILQLRSLATNEAGPLLWWMSPNMLSIMQPGCKFWGESTDRMSWGYSSAPGVPETHKQRISPFPTPPPTHTHSFCRQRWQEMEAWETGFKNRSPTKLHEAVLPKWETGANRKRRNSDRCQKPNPTNFWIILSKTSQAYSIIGKSRDDGHNNCLSLRKLNMIIPGNSF